MQRSAGMRESCLPSTGGAFGKTPLFAAQELDILYDSGSGILPPPSCGPENLQFVPLDQRK